MSQAVGRSAMIAEKALELCGKKFRFHGRDPATGVDCIGLAELCLSGAGVDCEAPTGYSLRGGNLEQVSKFMALAGFTQLPPDSVLCEGDIVLVRPSPVQLHFMIRTQDGFVHAHAGLSKVSFCPGGAPWPILSIFRLLEN